MLGLGPRRIRTLEIALLFLLQFTEVIKLKVSPKSTLTCQICLKCSNYDDSTIFCSYYDDDLTIIYQFLAYFKQSYVFTQRKIYFV